MVDDTGVAANGHRPLINIFTCADRKYQDFSVLFAVSNLYHVKDSVVEIGLEDPEGFALENKKALSLLDDEFGRDRVILRGARFRMDGRRVRPGTVRFIETPSKCEYVYISDIDIITLDTNLVDVHVAFMKRRNLAYSNSVRVPDPTRMSGLHFARYDDWYPLPSVDDSILRKLSDEQVLRVICEQKGLHVQQEEWFRPVHGIHISPNRPPLGGTRNGVAIPGWSIGSYITAYQRFMQTPIMSEMRPLLSERIRCYLEDIDLVCSASDAEARLKVKEGLACKYQHEELPEARKCLLRNKQYSEASTLELEYLARHPDDAAIHRKAARTFGRLGDMASAVAHQRRAVQLEPSNADARRELATLLAQTGDAAAVH